MAFKTTRNDLIPMRAGGARLTPLDVNGNPIFARAVTTKRAYVVSTAITTSRSTETLPNGNGQDGEFPLDETYNIAVAMNTFDPKFHATAGGMKLSEKNKSILLDTTIVPTNEDATYTFSVEKDYPVADADGEYYFEIRDSYGNLLTAGGTPSSDVDNYTYENSSHKLTFNEKYKNVALSCVYYVNGDNGEAYEANTILKNEQFMLEVFGEVMSASTGEVEKYYARCPRAAISGDLPNVTTQKSKTNTITYNFKTMPVPEGIAPFYESFTPVEDAPAAAAAVSEKKSAPVKA